MIVLVFSCATLCHLLLFISGLQSSISKHWEKRFMPAGLSTYSSPDLTGPFLIQDGDNGYCLQAEGKDVVATICSPSKETQKWTFYDTDLLKNSGTQSCLQASGSNYSGVSMAECKSTTASKWGCNTKSSGRPGLRMLSADKCLRVNSYQIVDLRACDHKETGQLMRIYGQPTQFVCTRQTDVGTRTNDPNYYLLKNPKFQLEWNEKYMKVFFVYNKDSYARFETAYQTKSAALQAIKSHALETASILDKAYRQIKVRVILTGFEVWSDGDKIPVTDKYGTLKSAFREYSFYTLRKAYDFDSSVLIYGSNWDGSWSGAGMSSMCKMLSGKVMDEVFVMATHRDTSAYSLANLLSHEFGHQFNMGHPFEPSNPCPNYRLYGTRCTMGGNDWPKGFSAQFLKNIRTFKYSCMDKKPPQEKIFFCGNGILDDGEECDCGTSQDCLKSNPCCDGSICKLRKGAQCSSEACCTNCKFDETKPNCQGDVKVITAKSGQISYSTERRLTHKHWRIETERGKVIKLSFYMSNFEFQEDCPFDYIEVRDGATIASKILGKFCRVPQQVFIKSSTNTTLVTFHADRTYPSSFNIYHTAVDKREDYGKFYLRHFGGLCVTYDADKAYFVLTKACIDDFIFEEKGFLRHLKTGKCVKPDSEGNGASIILTADCESPEVLFTFNQGFALLHGASGKCIHPLYGYTYPPENNKIVLYSGCNHKKLQFKPHYPEGFEKQYFFIKHASGKCVHLDAARNVFVLSSTCDDVFTFTSKGRLLHLRSDDCVQPSSYSDGAPIVTTVDCSSSEPVFEFTEKGSMQHKLSGKCIQPKTGNSATTTEDETLMVHSGCDQYITKFAREKTYGLGTFFVIQHDSGKCFKYDVQAKRFILSSTCSDVFSFTKDGKLFHYQTKECVQPAGHSDGYTIVLTPECNSEETALTFTEENSLQHKVTGKCIHPRSGGFSDPPEGDPLVIYAGCDESRLIFNQMPPPKLD